MRDLPRKLSVEQLAELFEGRTRFVELLAERDDPLETAPDVVGELDEAEKLEALDAHPAIGAGGLSARSAAERSGGLILLTAGSSSRTSSSVRHRWWGDTSAVTSTPSSLARRISATDSAAEMWQRCSGMPS